MSIISMKSSFNYSFLGKKTVIRYECALTWTSFSLEYLLENSNFNMF